MRPRGEGTQKGRSRLAALLLPGFLSPREKGEILADLEELRLHRVRNGSRGRAFFQYWWEVVRYALALRWNGAAFRAPRGGSPGGTGREGLAGFAESVARDLRVAARALARSPGASFVAVATLALGIGATTAIFSFADALVLRPLPVREPGRVVRLLHQSATNPGSFSSFSFPGFQELGDRNEVFSDLAAFATGQLRLGEGEDEESVEGMMVSGNYFGALGAGMTLGRGFVAEEDRTAGTHPVAVLSHGLWERRFGGDPAIVGRSVTLNGHPFTVVGVAGVDTPALDLRSIPEIWVPLQMYEVILEDFSLMRPEYFDNRGAHWLSLVGRLNPGVTRAVAQGSMEALAAWQAETYPEENGDWTISVRDAEEARAGTPGHRPLVQATGLLAVVVGLVLLIACANVANILTARAMARSREMGVRLALGASRLRLVRQVLTEALLLAMLGGLAGLLLANWSMKLIPFLGLSEGYPGLRIALDLRVLAFASGVTLLTGIAFGLVPALRATGEGLARLGRGRGREGQSGRSWVGRSLLAVQVAFSLVLLIGSGLALRTLWNLRALPLGFEIENLQVAGLDLGKAEGPEGEGYTEEEGQQIYRNLLNETRSLAGVQAAGLARFTPFAPWRMANDILLEGGTQGGNENRFNLDMNVVGPGYFQAMGIPVVRGRAFSEQDRGGGPEVAVVNETAADLLWPGQRAVGRRLHLWSREGPGPTLEVVGVVGDGRYYRGWRSEVRPFLFLPLAQHHADQVSLVVRGRARGAPSPEILGRAVARVAPGLPTPEATPVRLLMDRAMGLERTNARVLGLFGLLALLISAIGVYGLVSFSVSQRTHEIGVRVALGARPLDVRRIIVTGCVLPVLAGTVAGWVTALGLGSFVGAFLFDVSATDPLTFGAMAALLAAVGVTAGLIPAQRATRVDPMEALQVE